MIRIQSLIRLFLSCVVFAMLAVPASAATVLEYDFSSGTQGFGGNNITGLTATGGFLTGVAASNDPQLILGAAQLPGGQAPGAGGTWTTLEYRVRETNSSGGGFVSFANASNTTGLVFSFNGSVVGTSNYSFVNAGSGFTDVTVDISSLGSTTLTNFRLDPIGGATNPVTTDNTFEVDFIRFSDSITAVPEPSSFALLGLAGCAITFRRKRAQRAKEVVA